MKKRARKQGQGKVAESRRLFMKKAVLGGAGATAAALGTGRIAAAAEEDGRPITIPTEFEAAEQAPRPAVDFPHDRRAGVRPRVQGGGRRGAVLLPGQLPGRARHGGGGDSHLLRAPRGLDGPRGRCVLPGDGRGRGDLRHRGAGVHGHDLRHRGGQRGALAAAGAGEQYDHPRRTTPSAGSRTATSSRPRRGCASTASG